MPIKFGIPVFLVLFLSTSAFAAYEPQFTLELGIDYGKGNFNTGYTYTYTMVPLILDWVPNERFNLELTVPYVKQTSSKPDNTATGNMATDHMPTGNMASGNMGIENATAVADGQGMMSGAGNGVALTNGENQSGLGDITLTGAYNLVLDGDGPLKIGVTGYLKFPTADKDKGLGTGAFDWGPGLLLSKRLGNWQPFAEGRYVFQGGSRAEIGARNYFLADAGLGYDWRENLASSLFCRFGTAVFDEMAAPVELRLNTFWGVRENTAVEFYLLKGLSSGSPDLGGGMSFLVAF